MKRERVVIEDAFGDQWQVLEASSTPHGFDVLLGRPIDALRGGAAVIITDPLKSHMELHRMRPGQADLPIGVTAMKRLRHLLGHHRQLDARQWWEDHADDLAELTLEQFAAKHGRKAGAVERARLALLGRKFRPYGWWKEGEAADLLRSDKPRAFVADALGISVGAVGRLRWALRYGHGLTQD